MPYPFALSLSKGRYRFITRGEPCFDKLSTNGAGTELPP
jgi:hypothetical protein